MKKSTIILLATLGVAVVGFFAYISFTGNAVVSKDCCKTSCSKDSKCEGNAAARDGRYDSMMSAVCESACGVKDYDLSKVVAQSIAQNGDLTKCPVSGAVFLLNEGSVLISYEGKTYHTCCATCSGLFNADPGKYSNNIN